METDIAIIIGRVCERLFIAVMGGVSILSGVYLLLKGITGMSDAEWKSNNFTFKFVKVSPGVLFGAFGMFILIFTMNSKIEMSGGSDPGEPNTKKLAFVGGGATVKNYPKAINTVTDFIRRDLPIMEGLLNVDRERLKKAEEIISAVHFQNFQNKFGIDQVAWFNEIKSGAKSLKSELEKTKFSEMKEFYNEKLK